MSVGEIVAFVVLGIPFTFLALEFVAISVYEIAVIVKDTIDYWRR